MYTSRILKIPFLNSNQTKSTGMNFVYPDDECTFENPNINKNVLVNKGIIDKNQNINSFFDEISSKIFSDNKKNAQNLSNLLKEGYISLSTSCYSDIKHPSSAVGVELDKNKSTISHCAYLEEYISQNKGVGINFSNLANPIDEIKKINEYFKFREPNLKRPSAAIALMDIKSENIIDFITLKDDAKYSDWCFDLSVIIDDEFLNQVDNNEFITFKNGKKIAAREIYKKLLNSMLKSGEPGIIFSNNKNYLCDCCAAAPLKKDEELTLAHINLSKFYNQNSGKIDFGLLKTSSAILSSAMQKIDSNGYIGILGYSSLLDKMGYRYGSNEAIKILEDCLKIIKKEANSYNIKTAISPTGGVSRLLKTSPSIEPAQKNINYFEEIDTLSAAQKYMDGGISKTINLKKSSTIEDIDAIIRYCAKNNIKGISVFRDK